jgi:2-C-methyl-D-erythritol 2,4-cyclodiphosphate synthase
MVLGGLRIDAPVHCAGHSDGDAVCHALTDAVLGAAGLGDIGTLFPDSAPENAGRDSIEMLALALRQVHESGWSVGQVDVVVIAQEVRIAPHREAMRQRLAGVLGVTLRDVSVKGKTNERMGWIGRGEGLAVIATATLVARAAQG